MMNNFHTYITSDDLPGIVPCQALMQKNPGLFQGRDWRHLKNWVRNYKVKIARQRKKLQEEITK